MAKIPISEIREKALEIRRLIVEMCHRTGMEYKAHPGPALSIADIVATLYFGVMKINVQDPKWPVRDRLVLSKGHACPAIYAALSLKGFFSSELLDKIRHPGAILQGHPDMVKTPGIDMTTGSLGNGLSAAAGIAAGGKMSKMDYYVYVILGDGEMQEGIVWEGALTCSNYRLNNIIAFIDKNSFQSCGELSNIINVEPLEEKWKSFGWDTSTIDGHSVSSILDAIERAKKHGGKPSVIIANTVKGKGVSFMENDNSWHQKWINDEEYRIAISELEKANL